MKIFITDYDGTLFINENKIKSTVKKLTKLQNDDFIIVIATGRSYSSIKNQTTIYNIPYDYLICADGSIIYNKKNTIEKMYPMNNEIIKPLEEFYQTLKYEEIQFSYPEYYSNILNSDNKLLGINICLSTKNYNQEIVDDFFKIANHYPNYNFLNYTHPNFSYLCVKPKNISKSFAIKYLIKKHKVLKKDLYVIGDSLNDYEMIKDYNGVCVRNSYPEILKISKKIYENINDYIDDIKKND